MQQELVARNRVKDQRFAITFSNQRVGIGVWQCLKQFASSWNLKCQMERSTWNAAIRAREILLEKDEQQTWEELQHKWSNTNVNVRNTFARKWFVTCPLKSTGNCILAFRNARLRTYITYSLIPYSPPKQQAPKTDAMEHGVIKTENQCSCMCRCGCATLVAFPL